MFVSIDQFSKKNLDPGRNSLVVLNFGGNTKKSNSFNMDKVEKKN